MSKFCPDKLAQWVSSLWKNGIPPGNITGVSIDTRTIEPGNLYVAIRGERFDGHDFVADAFEKGATGALVNDDFELNDRPLLPVPDTIKGLQQLAAGYRKTWMASVVGITGSVGKTTVKEMCAEVLAKSAETHRTAGNLNNHIGLPLSMMQMDPSARHGVFEIGMNHPGEIEPLSKLLSPDIGMITCIGSAHIENFNSVHEIAEEKAKLIENVSADGYVILDRDSEWFELLSSKTDVRVVTVSLGGEADYSGRVAGERELEVDGYHYTMPLPGEHMMRNALKAIALGLESGLLIPEEIDEGIANLQLPPMRWEEKKIGEVTFINDAYNANQLSMRAVLNTFVGQSAAGLKWAVLGGMRELGDEAEREHAELGEFIDRLDLDGVITVGELGQMIVCKELKNFYQVESATEAVEVLKSQLRPGDRVLLKASRGERLEDVLTIYERETG